MCIRDRVSTQSTGKSKMSHHTANTMAALCVVGGVAGYAKTQSKPSLIAGVSIGLLYGISGLLIKENNDLGYDLATVTSAVLGLAMIPRAVKTKKIVPIALGSVSLLSGGYYAKKSYEARYGV
eukprot:TRINITY_DN3639_c0_g1_i1.p1 TRINITY_DN3639_c0_g1~~TRINITY_DN3639_c0_g1_i1.p1  ORF type:complete len:123 (-),score=32.30 TRINITY_DN3639_c0_g1_i1:52-420(-)